MGTMTTTSGEDTEPRALAALAELGRDGVKQPTPAELDQGLSNLLARVGADGARRRGAMRWSLIAAAATVCVLGGIGLVSVSRRHSPTREASTLSYQIEGGSVLEGGYLREHGHAGIKLLFSEGSKVVLTPGTRGRLRAVGTEGARLAVEHGTASFQVTPSGDRRWLVEVGPFLVTVKGTVFSVSWDPLSERFELMLRRGRVAVSGPVSGGDIILRAGQRLVVSLAKAETFITEESPEEPAPAAALTPTPPAVRPSVEGTMPAGLKPPAAPAASSVSNGARDRRWAHDLANGRWDRILEDAERAGVESTLDKASSEDLFALADAARYRRRRELALAALLAERRRFPDSPRALDATFLLGRVEEAHERGETRAIAWYDEYLARAPTGAYAAEALGRKMTLTRELRGAGEARPIAEEYLRRFPRGSYAGLAHALRRAP